MTTRYYLHPRSRDLVAWTSEQGRTLQLDPREWSELDRGAYETLLRQRRERVRVEVGE